MHANIYRGLIFYIRPAAVSRTRPTRDPGHSLGINVHLHCATRVRPVVRDVLFRRDAAGAKVGVGPLVRGKRLHRENHKPKVERCELRKRRKKNDESFE